jgi:hypothetical protein
MYNYPESIALVRQNFASAFLISRHVNGTAEVHHWFEVTKGVVLQKLGEQWYS